MDFATISILTGLLFTAFAFVLTNFRCILDKEDKTLAKALLLVLISPFFFQIIAHYLFVLLIIPLEFVSISRANATILKIFLAIFCYLGPLNFFIFVYRIIIKSSRELALFSYTMFWIIQINTEVIAGNLMNSLPIAIILFSIWYAMFHNDLRFLANNANNKDLAEMNISLIISFISNIILLLGSVYAHSIEDAYLARLTILYLMLLGISVFTLMMVYFRFIFSLIRQRLAIREQAQTEMELAKETRDTQENLILAFSEMVDNKSGQTGHHVKRVSIYSYIIAKAIGLDENNARRIGIASMMHDVGKLFIPNEILEKKGRLTPEEFDIMKMHTYYGEELLNNASGEILQSAKRIAAQHHERPDGKGYPRGLTSEKISIGSKITSVSDVFDALTSKRSYKEAWPVEKAKMEIIENSGTQFDPIVVKGFEKAYADIIRIRKENLDADD